MNVAHDTAPYGGYRDADGFHVGVSPWPPWPPPPVAPHYTPYAPPPPAPPPLVPVRPPRVYWQGGDKAAMAHQFERMEWFGDALLELAVAEDLYSRFPDDDEDLLSRRMQLIVGNDTLTMAARTLQLPEILIYDNDNIARCNRERREATAKRNRIIGPGKKAWSAGGPDKWLADAFEALVCAVYFARSDPRTGGRVEHRHQDGFDAVKAFVVSFLLEGVIRGAAGSETLQNSALDPELRADGPEEATAGASAGSSKGSKRKRAALCALDDKPPERPQSTQKHPKALLLELAHEFDWGQVEYRHHMSDGRHYGTVSIDGTNVTPDPVEGLDHRSALTNAAAAFLATMPEPIKERWQARSQARKASRPEDDTAPSGGGESANRREHPRTLLQTLVHAFPDLGEVHYDRIADRGLNAPGRFTVAVRIGGERIAEGTGPNQKAACTAAAVAALPICQERTRTMTRPPTFAPPPLEQGSGAGEA